jgi:hypothetical protein
MICWVSFWFKAEQKFPDKRHKESHPHPYGCCKHRGRLNCHQPMTNQTKKSLRMIFVIPPFKSGFQLCFVEVML